MQIYFHIIDLHLLIKPVWITILKTKLFAVLNKGQSKVNFSRCTPDPQCNCYVCLYVFALTFHTHGSWAVIRYRRKGPGVVGEVGEGFPAFVTIVHIVSWWTVNQMGSG